ncbi:MAG: hypothetical protein V7L20_18400 [Nostoc sp.]
MLSTYFSLLLTLIACAAATPVVDMQGERTAFLKPLLDKDLDQKIG